MPDSLRNKNKKEYPALPPLIIPPVEELRKWNARFTPDIDEDLAALLNQRSDGEDNFFLTVDPSKFIMTKEEKVLYMKLAAANERDVRVRVAFFMEFGEKLLAAARYVDFTLLTHRPLLATLLQTPHVKKLFLNLFKQMLFTKALFDTIKQQESLFPLQIDMFKSGRLWTLNKTDVNGDKSVFGQVFQQLELGKHTQLNKFGDPDNDPWRFHIGGRGDLRAWHTLLKGLNATDAGGPYREVLFQMCRELQSARLPLFIPAPNTRDQLGKNQSSWVPNPSATAPLHLNMYRFVGKLMGLAIRTKDFLQFDFPSIVWKPLVGAEVTEDDVLAIDRLSFALVDQMRTVEQQLQADPSFDPAMFNEAMVDSKFTVIGSDQKTYPLIENGANISVDWNNRNDFVRELIKYRKHEFRVQVAAIREGLPCRSWFLLVSLHMGRVANQSWWQAQD